MRFERVGIGLVGAIAGLATALAVALIWLFLTNPDAVATAVAEGEVAPFVRDLADALLRALEGLLKYL